MKGSAQRVAVGLGVALACTPIPTREQSTLPINTCPQYPCEAYAPPTPPTPLATCTASACVVATAVPGDLVLLVAIPKGSALGADRMFVIRLADLIQTSNVPSLCFATHCVHLPPPTPVSGSYDVQASEATTLGSTLVAHNTATSLPVHVTYRALWPPDASSPANDAFGAGLPIYPVEAQPTPPPVGVVGFETYLQSSLTYERTILPDSPFDQEFPPDVNLVTEPTATGVHLELQQFGIEFTIQVQPGKNLPTFDLSRTDGTLNGWTAYLRDATTKRPISPIKSISGTATADGGLLLPTQHHPSPPDALTNAELVMAPPAAQQPPLPTYVLAPQGGTLPAHETYPALPPAATVQGSIAWSDRQPVAADLIFEAMAVYAASPIGIVDPGDGGLDAEAGDASGSTDGGTAGGTYLLQPNFEFVAHTSPEPNPVSGTSTFQVVLPRGIYRVIVRPHDPTALDGSQGVLHALAIVDGFDTGDGFSAGSSNPVRGPGLSVDVAPTVNGTATIADGRALSGATVDALAVGCAAPAGDAALKPKDTPSCMPRAVQTVTAADGSFALALDPGDYVLRVEPAEGTRLPWVLQPLHVSGSRQVAFVIPAPVHQQLQLADALGNLIANAIVHVFTMPAQRGQAVEVGSTITDRNGRFDLYLDPNLPRMQ